MLPAHSTLTLVPAKPGQLRAGPPRFGLGPTNCLDLWLLYSASSGRHTCRICILVGAVAVPVAGLVGAHRASCEGLASSCFDQHKPMGSNCR